MGIGQRFKQIIKQGDFFNSYQLLRYQKETEYRTFTGGLISIGIIVTIIIAFASMILDTINRTTINFTQNSQRFSDPTLSTIIASPDTNFMFGVQVWGYNLSSQNRLFDVVFAQIESNYGDNYTYTNYSLEACTAQHWALLPDVVSKFDRLSVGNWLCPSIGTVIKLQGRYSSQFYHQFSVNLYPCSNNTDPSRPCGSPQDINQFFIDNGQWNYFTFFYINSIINPAQPEYKSYYLEDRTYISFGPQMGAQLDMYLSQIDIETDQSIWPFQDLTEDTLFTINYSPILYPFAIQNGTSYATFYVMKDPTQTNYQRAVQKIFVVFSFMGGLIGAVMACLFIINSYTSFAYQLALALELFQQSQHSKTHRQLKQEQQATINIIHYIQYYVYIILGKIVKKLDWPFIKYIHECREEIHEQLDIKGLIKRIIFLEYTISYVLEDYHLSEMQLKRPVMPSQIKSLRQRIQAKEVLEEEVPQDSGQNLFPIYQQIDNVHEKEKPSIQLSNGKLCPIKPNIFQNQINAQIISYGDSQSGHRVANEFQLKKKSIKKRTINFKKLKESAMEGNQISRKLLMVVENTSDIQSSSRQLENISCAGFFNKKAISISKIIQK